MDSLNPFSTDEEERWGLRNLFRVVSAGGNPISQPETRELYSRYKTILNLFETMIDVRYGNFLFLPFEGGVMDQPSHTMDCLKYLQSLFRQKIAEEERRRGGRF